MYEEGKSDNGWRTFHAGGLDWLVLSLELWPRAGVVAWADGVIGRHPRHNVIVMTHSFLDADGAISTSNGGYGATDPMTVWRALEHHPNLVMVFAGHTGQVTSTTVTAADGHPVATFLQAMHAPSTNPVRIVTVDTAHGTLHTEVRSSWDSSRPAGERDVELVHPYTATLTGLRWVG